MMKKDGYVIELKLCVVLAIVLIWLGVIWNMMGWPSIPFPVQVGLIFTVAIFIIVRMCQWGKYITK